MNLESLANKEIELYSMTIDLYHQPQSEENNERLKVIFKAYKEVHRNYANLSDIDNEALKRGLFIQWYAMTEPNYLTGIDALDEQAEHLIIESLNQRILNNDPDWELKWMLDYYTSWDWIFDKFKDYEGLRKAIKIRQANSLPTDIDNDNMNNRGQMGKYWNSLTAFNKK
ncbi:hypothetical protein NF867_09395 [Solitalea sp. MAHUQ-68]|uniref:Uncharacterized protein n=2 Tax=Sphingobacteriaceae TaxID=84566 RepID=A0A9X2JC23_9SPHI|nr:hypothetical protein [Solitalea agri]